MKQSEEEGKKKALEMAVTYIKKQFGEGAIMSMGEGGLKRQHDVIKTGALSLDIALGIGGLPKGRVVEIYGPESSGKSTLATHAVASCQQAGGTAAYIDAEHALDPTYAEKIGVNLDKLMISQPDCGEEALNIVEMLARSNAVDLIVVDSVAALVPKSELDGEIGDTHVGLQARMMSQALRKLTSTLSRSNTCCIFINQIREKIGVMFGSPETTTGGRALKFYSSVRLDIRRIATLKGSDGVEFGLRAKVKCVKNKMAPPFRIGEFDILFNEGISRLGSIIDLGVEQEIIDKKGSWFSYKEKRLGQGKEGARAELKAHPELANEIEQLIIEKLLPSKSPSPEAPETAEMPPVGALNPQ
ncbi:MAG: Protein RecA [Chlamydiia bacterium]|nr:Protein RecA [Chlamydiia bacterium]MCH9616341.1 Protein RecA [Chlamydiia bacterium]MCH9629673.1 Protein RecA [Chlamydiia bacterium]